MKVILSILNSKERNLIEKEFKRSRVFTEIFVYEDIIAAISEMERSSAELAIFDLAVFKRNVMETLSLIKDVQSQKPALRFMLLANKEDDVMTSAALRFGVSYAMIRPFNPEDIVSRAVDLCSIKSDEGIIVNESRSRNIFVERTASSVLSGTGILPNLKGYKYLKEAIVKGYNDMSILDAVTKYLYPEIAKNNNTTAERVERAIRHAIDSAWSKCGGNGFYTKMGFGEVYNNKRPTNSEYIFAVVEYLNNTMY